MRAFTKLLSSSLLRAISQDEHYGRHEFGNYFRLCWSLSTQKLELSMRPTASHYRATRSCCKNSHRFVKLRYFYYFLGVRSAMQVLPAELYTSPSFPIVVLSPIAFQAIIDILRCSKAVRGLSYSRIITIVHQTHHDHSSYWDE